LRSLHQQEFGFLCHLSSSAPKVNDRANGCNHLEKVRQIQRGNVNFGVKFSFQEEADDVEQSENRTDLEGKTHEMIGKKGDELTRNATKISTKWKVKFSLMISMPLQSLSKIFKSFPIFFESLDF
jgi:hypothetical protein